MSQANDNGPDNTGSDDERRIGEQPIDGDGRYAFAGLTRYDDDVDIVDLPGEVWEQQSSMKYWAQTKPGIGADPDPSVLPERGLNTLIPELPRANHAEAAWIHPRTGKVMRTGKHNAVIDPSKAENAVGGYQNYAEAIADVTERDIEGVSDDLSHMKVSEYLENHLSPEQRAEIEEAGVGDDALYQIAGQNHSIINPQQPLEEFVNVLQDQDLGDKVFGEVTIDRGGGRATLDVYFDGKHVESPVFGENREPVVVGVQVQWSFFDDWAFRANGQALDWSCTNMIHRLTDREVVKYAGDVEGRQNWYEWFEQIMSSLETKRDQLSRIIQAAANEHLDFSDLPEDIASEFEKKDAAPWTALYAYLGLPNYLAEHAGKRLRAQADDAYEPNWWEIHSAATFAVTHHDKGDRTAGGSYEDHARVANDMLMNPAGMEERVIENYVADRREDGQATLADEGGGEAQIKTAFENTREKRERFEEWEEDLRSLGIEV